MNNDLISRSALIPNGVFYANADDPLTSLDELIKRIWSTPSVDAVEVVRCKDCKHFLTEKLLCTHEGNMVFNTGKTTYPNCFCSYGERKGDDGT